ncbi:uncharacterized protein LOC128279126 [Anopheles cruzii]|uniref:uncharacterized protein LOC128279126 n=1 Tax=Anopheles cruzii TaxID=68878 RepID=UPI0022EC7E07|nr:uncharacterized protein LOC128279126 [Anopheles cruzii]
MHTLFLYGYAGATIGMAISVLYFGMHTINQRRLQHLVLNSSDVLHHLYAFRRMRPVTRKYVNAYRTKLVQRRLLKKINQLRPRIALHTEMPRWQLVSSASGSLRAVPCPE